MRRSIFIAIMAVAACAAAFYAIRGGGWDIANAPARGERAVAFGDSLVAGFGATQGNDFVSVLSRLSGIPIKNLGRNGDTTGSALARLDSVIAEKPDVVLILLGGNDYLRNIPAGETFGNLASMIERLQAQGAAVVLLGVRGGILADSYESEFKKVARENEAAYVPNVLDGIWGDARLMSDAIHPNDEGYRMIAEKVLPELMRALGR